MRKLPEEPSRRRRQYLKRIYQKLEHFRSLRETGAIDLIGIVTTPEGEEIYLDDLMIGIDSLPPQQRRAFELICCLEYTETDATKIILPGSKWSTPVQQYSDSALDRMIASYDEFQATGKKPTPYVDRRQKNSPDASTDVAGDLDQLDCPDGETA